MQCPSDSSPKYISNDRQIGWRKNWIERDRPQDPSSQYMCAERKIFGYVVKTSGGVKGHLKGRFNE